MKAKLDRKDIEKMKYNDVKKLAKDMNLDVTGSKQDIIERICSVDVEIDDPTDEEIAEIGKVESEQESKTDSENDTEDTSVKEITEEQTTTSDEQKDAQNAENEPKTESKKNDNRLEIDGVLKIIFSGQVRLRRTPYYDKENVIKLEPNGSIFRVVAVVKNELNQSFYELSNGAYIAKDDKLVEFKVG